MITECTSIDGVPLAKKNVAGVIDCIINYRTNEPGLDEVKHLVEKLAEKLGIHGDIILKDNEPIGTEYLIYRFRIYLNNRSSFISARIIRHRERLFRAVLVFPQDYRVVYEELKRKVGSKEEGRTGTVRGESIAPGQRPPGQKYIPGFIIYKILGQPIIDPISYRLRIDGLTERILEYSIDELEKLPMIEFISDFHCVTGWSVRDVRWKGVPLRFFYEEAGVRNDARWVVFTGLDGYTSIVPLEDYLAPNSVLVLYMDDKRISIEQGYPARIFIPHLYGWKGAKWVSRITFMDEYRDGYWEALGYHPRGNVWLEERFKKTDYFNSPTSL